MPRNPRLRTRAERSSALRHLATVVLVGLAIAAALALLYYIFTFGPN